VYVRVRVHAREFVQCLFFPFFAPK
jgi:hypothetical protein